jgi:hypothetical protein
MATLERKLRDKYNSHYGKVFGKEFQETVKRADESRKILSRLKIVSACRLIVNNG